MHREDFLMAAERLKNGRGLRVWLMILAVWSGLALSAPAQLTTAIQVRSLTPAEAAEEREVKLRAVVTDNDSPQAVFVQDATGGTFFRPGGVVALRPGDEVEIHGFTEPALYVPGIVRATFQVVGRSALPEATVATYADLVSGRFHYQRVSVEGVVRSVASVDENWMSLRLVQGTQIVEVFIRASPESERVAIDSRVRVCGLASGQINPSRQLVQPYVQAASWRDVEELEPAPAAHDMRMVSTKELLTFNTTGHTRRRVRLRGTVLAAFPDGMAFLRDEEGAVAVKFSRPGLVEVGDQAEVIGFPEMSQFSASLVDAGVLSREPGTPPEAVETTLPELIARRLDCELVTVTATVVEWLREGEGVALTLRGDGQIVRARIPSTVVGPEAGAEVRVTGICQVESIRPQAYLSTPAAVSLRVRLPEDVRVVRSPPWWNARRLMFALVAVSGLALMAAMWILGLRRQVRRQTAALRGKIERESALEERQRLAREFHDTLEQDLTGVSLQLSTATARNFDEKGRGLVAASRNLVERIQLETRLLVSDLRESGDGAMGPVDLVAMLHTIVGERLIGDQLTLRVETTLDACPVPAPSAHHLRMMVQESITNALKHAQAKIIRLGLELQDEGLVIRIADDGRGFDPSAETFGKPGHFGCIGMRERCQKIGATVSWHLATGGGTEVEIVLKSPILAAARPAHAA